MDRSARGRRPEERVRRSRGDVPGIVITDGGVGSRASGQSPRVRAFVYAERMPTTPTLPFGRWKPSS